VAYFNVLFRHFPGGTEKNLSGFPVCRGRFKSRVVYEGGSLITQFRLNYA
jgi:hypothetical protein